MFQNNKEVIISNDETSTADEMLFFSQYSATACIAILLFTFFTLAISLLWCMCFASWIINKFSKKNKKQ